MSGTSAAGITSPWPRTSVCGPRSTTAARPSANWPRQQGSIPRLQRWVTQGRTPHRVNAVRAAAALGEDVSVLWPDIERGRRQPGPPRPDRRLRHPRRSALQTWRALFEQAGQRSASSCTRPCSCTSYGPDFNRLLAGKARQGCQVTVLIGDPDRTRSACGAGRKASGTASRPAAGRRSCTTRPSRDPRDRAPAARHHAVQLDLHRR